METKSDKLHREKFNEDLLRGQKFQDFCCAILWHKRNTPVCNLQSHEFQKIFGENLQMEEFKYDERSKETKNLFIETEERILGSQDLHPAGIYQSDPAIRYTIGNYEMIWRFSKAKLVKAHKTGKYQMADVSNKKTGMITARGFLLPKREADEMCEDKIEGLEDYWKELKLYYSKKNKGAPDGK